MLSEKEFLAGWERLLSEHKDFEVIPGTVAVYRERMNQLTPQQWEHAVNRCLDTKKFFPKISELLDVVRNLRPTSMDVWNKLIHVAEHGEKPEMDEPTAAALEAVGGWEKFSVTPYKDLIYLLSHFGNAYQRAQERQEAAQGFPGIEPPMAPPAIEAPAGSRLLPDPEDPFMRSEK